MAGSSLLDVCRFNPTAGGTTDWTYSSAVTGYQSPSAANVVNGAQYSYRAESADLSQWEIGTGTYNTSTGVLSRTTVLFNSSGTTSKISFSVAPQVAIVALAEDLVRSIAGNSGAFTLSHGITNSGNDIQLALNNATLQANPTNPAGSSGNVMMGLGATCKITPVYSGRLMVLFHGNYSNASAGIGTDISARYGTGTAPSNGAASTGTAIGVIKHMNNSIAGGADPFGCGGIVTGLTTGTAYWFDLLLNGNGTTATPSNIDCSIFEF